MQRLTNTVRRYAWGTTDVIADLTGGPADGGPQAELWIGAHADSPSVLADGRRLDVAVAEDPVALLGPRVLGSFGPRLPFLLKILSAAAPLSLQVHPSQEQAREGFAAEEAARVPQDAPHRRYKDPHHKPEMIVALTPFEALCGLRPPAEVLVDVDALEVEHPLWDALGRALAEGPAEQALRRAVSLLLSGDDQVPSLVAGVVEACAAAGDAASRSVVTVVDLARTFPGDPGVLVSLLLHRVTLQPWEALYLPAGNVHAYLSGTGVEVMAGSDNVLRAGLTPKHVDVDELVRLVDFTPRPVPWVSSEQVGPVTWYLPGAREFALAHARLDGAPVDVVASGPRVVLVLEGAVDVATGTGTASVPRGGFLFLADDDGPVTLTGSGSAVVVAVPPVGATGTGRQATSA